MTDAYIGIKGSVIVFGEEDPRGTAVTTDRSAGAYQSWSFNETKDVVETHSDGSVESIAITTGKYKVGGSFNVRVQRFDMLEYILGEFTDTTTTYTTHTRNGADNCLKSITLGKSFYDCNADATILTGKYVGTVIKSVDINLNDRDPINMDVSWEAIKPDNSTDTVANVSLTDNLFGAKQWSFKIADQGGSPAALPQVTDCKLSFKRDVTTAGGSGSVSDLQKDLGLFTTRITGNMFFYSKDMYDDFMNSSTTVADGEVEKVIEITGTNGLATTALRSFSFTIEHCNASDFNTKRASNTSYIIVPFTYTGRLEAVSIIDNTANWNA